MTVEWSKWGLNEIIGCCLYKRQHLIISFLGHSSDWMTVEWSKWGLNERIRCCLYMRQHLILSFLGHSSHWMTIEWSKWGLNERIGCCLYKRQHLILSFLGHSSVILTSFHEQYWTVLYLNETGMTEWQWNDQNGVRMKESGAVSIRDSTWFFHS